MDETIDEMHGQRRYAISFRRRSTSRVWRASSTISVTRNTLMPSERKGSYQAVSIKTKVDRQLTSHWSASWTNAQTQKVQGFANTLSLSLAGRLYGFSEESLWLGFWRGEVYRVNHCVEVGTRLKPRSFLWFPCLSTSESWGRCGHV